MKRFTLRLIFLCIVLLCLSSACPFVSAEEEAKLPTVAIRAESLSDWSGKSDIREATLTYSDPNTGRMFVSPITIRPQGTSSLGYDKKNFTIVMQDDGVEMQPGWGVQTEYCLKANYIDPTHSGNVVSARLVGQMNESTGLFEGLPDRGAIDGFPVWVTLNGEDAGLYTWNIPKSGWMFGMDEENPNHIVMCGENWSDGSALYDACFYLNEDWSIEFGPETSGTIVKFARLTDFIANSSDEEFIKNFDQYLNLDACLNYYCFMCISSAHDNAAKNMLMVTWDGQIWQPMLYDLDSLWGIDYTGMDFTTSYALNLAYNSGNRLFERILEHFRPQLNERYALLRGGVLSTENILSAFSQFAASIPADALEKDHQMWNPDGVFIRTHELMEQQINIYLPRIDTAFGYR